MTAEILSYPETEELLESIVSNKKLVQVKSRTGVKFFLLRHPNVDEVIFSRYVRQQALLEAEAEGLPSREDIENIVRDKKILTEEDENKIKELEEKISGQLRLLQITRIEGRRKPIQENIARFQKEITEIKSKSRDLLYMSSEVKADEETMLYLTWAGSYSLRGEKYWPTLEDFGQEKDLRLRSNIIEAFNAFNQGHPTKKVRFLARHPLWRIRYSAALKTGGSLFSRELYDLTPDQMSLLYWSDYYQTIFELLPDDRPDDETIKDDDALDSYMEALTKRKQEERNEGRVKRGGGLKGKGKLSAWERGEELIITPSHPEYLSMSYSEKRIQAPEGVSEIQVVDPRSKRARNRASARRTRR